MCDIRKAHDGHYGCEGRTHPMMPMDYEADADTKTARYDKQIAALEYSMEGS